MPTAAKLVALLCFALAAYVVARLAIPYVFEEGEDPGRFPEISAALGALFGWIMAPRHPGGLAAAVSHGLTTAVAIAVAVLFLNGFGIMLRQSLKRMYDGPVDALGDVVAIMARNAQALLHQDVAVAALVGALVAGVLTEWAGRNFR